MLQVCLYIWVKVCVCECVHAHFCMQSANTLNVSQHFIRVVQQSLVNALSILPLLLRLVLVSLCLSLEGSRTWQPPAAESCDVSVALHLYGDGGPASAQRQREETVDERVQAGVEQTEQEEEVGE